MLISSPHRVAVKKSANEKRLFSALIARFPITKNALRQPRSNGESSIAKPFVQWVGGKREMISQYERFFPKVFNRYYEPFLGGGAIFFYFQPLTAILGDSNLELVRSYEGVRDYPDEVVHILKNLKAKHSEKLYLAVRELDRKINIFEEMSNAEIAARIIYLNQTCFNGVYRVNQSGQFNVPIGSSLNRLICDEDTIFADSEILKKAIIKHTDFEDLISDTRKNDFVYFDPPYFPVSVYSDFTRYTKEKFYEEDQVRLKAAIDKLSKKGVKVMLSNSDCKYINELYATYNRNVVHSGRTLNCKKDQRGKVSELFITNY